MTTPVTETGRSLETAHLRQYLAMNRVTQNSGFEKISSTFSDAYAEKDMFSNHGVLGFSPLVSQC